MAGQNLEVFELQDLAEAEAMAMVKDNTEDSVVAAVANPLDAIPSKLII